jgi:prophage regulatory protein
MTHTGNILSLLRAYDIVLDTPTVTPSFLDLRGNFITVQIPRGTCRNPSIAMLFYLGDIVMRILSKRQVKELVLYSPQHTARLEKAGLFPKRVQLGPNRVGWVESEVLEWLEQRLAQREVLN